MSTPSVETETELAVVARRLVASLFALPALATAVDVVRGDEVILASLEKAPHLVVGTIVLHALLAVSLWRGPRFTWIARGVGSFLFGSSPILLIILLSGYGPKMGLTGVALVQSFAQGAAILLALRGQPQRARLIGAGALGALSLLLRLVAPAEPPAPLPSADATRPGVTSPATRPALE